MASPVSVACNVSPDPPGSLYWHETGLPITVPSCALSVAKPSANCGFWPGWQYGAVCRADGSELGASVLTVATGAGAGVGTGVGTAVGATVGAGGGANNANSLAS